LLPAEIIRVPGFGLNGYGLGYFGFRALGSGFMPTATLAHLPYHPEPEPRWRTAAEPRRRSVFLDPSRFATSPVRPPDAISSPPLSDVWARAHGFHPRRLGPFAYGARARPKSPRAQLTENPFSFFPFLFLFFLFSYICIYVDILCTKNSPNIP
jgi:hypothetical protein